MTVNVMPCIHRSIEIFDTIPKPAPGGFLYCGIYMLLVQAFKSRDRDIIKNPWAADPSKIRRPVHICPLYRDSKSRSNLAEI